MVKKIPKDLHNLYQKAGWLDKLYLKLRWQLCPFEEIEKYVPQSGKIYDLGCGVGILSNLLAFKSPDREIIGVDLSLKRIKVADLSVGDRKNIRFFREDVKDFDLELCDGVVMTDFLHHVFPVVAERILKLIYKKLNPKGKLVIQEVDKFPRWKYLITFSIDRFLNLGKPLYYRLAKDWKEMLQKIGFKVEIIPAHQGLFLSDVLLICTKNENNRNSSKS